VTATRPIIGREAENELYDAANWYEARSEGLGIAFLDGVEGLLERIAENPRQFQVVYQDVRRALLRRFPYGVFFRARASGAIKIIAVMHSARSPDRWRKGRR
jgi:plasmid stabilization system protein ParE